MNRGRKAFALPMSVLSGHGVRLYQATMRRAACAMASALLKVTNASFSSLSVTPANPDFARGAHMVAQNANLLLSNRSFSEKLHDFLAFTLSVGGLTKPRP